MPKPEQNKANENKNEQQMNNMLLLNGKYGLGGAGWWIERNYFSVKDFNRLLDPAHDKKVDGYYNTYSDSTVTEPVASKRLRGQFRFPGFSTMMWIDTDIDVQANFLGMLLESKDLIKNASDNLSEENKEFKPFLNAFVDSMDLEAGDFARAMNDSHVLGMMGQLLAYGPLVPGKDIPKTQAEIADEALRLNIPENQVDKNKHEIDYAQMKANLGDAFQPLMTMYQDYSDLLHVEYERQKVEDGLTTPEEEKDITARYKSALDKTIKDFKVLKQVEIDNPKKYGRNVLNNTLDELVGVSVSEFRSISTGVAFMEGQSKALENGWNLEDSYIPGSLSQTIELVNRYIPHITKELESERSQLSKNEKKLNDSKKEIERLKGITFSDQELEAIDKLRADNEELIVNYGEYANELAAMKKDKSIPKEKIDNYINENKELADKYKAYDTEMRRLTKADELEKLEKLEKEIPNLENSIIKNKENIERDESQISYLKDASKEYGALDEKIRNTKVENLNDKRKFLSEFQNINKKYSDKPLVLDTFSNSVLSSFRDHLEETAEYYKNGRLKDVETKPDNFYVHNFYAPQPKMKDAWFKDTTITEEQYGKLQHYDAENLPFNELEITMLGVGGALNADDPNVVSAFNNSRFTKETEGTVRQKMVKAANFFTDDMIKSGAEPRQGIGKYIDIVEAGRQGAKSAMESYVKGDKMPLAKIIYSGMHTAEHCLSHSDGVESSSLHYSAMLESYSDILKRDPELRDKLKEYNNTLPEEDKLDFDRLDHMKKFLKVRAKGLKAEEALKADEDKKELNPAEKRQLEKDVLKGVVYDKLEYIDRKTLVHMPEYQSIEAEQKKLTNSKEFNTDPVAAMNKVFALQAKSSQMLYREGETAKNIASPEGKKKFEEFIEDLYTKFDIKPSGSSIHGKDEDLADLAIRKFAYELESDKILKELSNPSKEYTQEEKYNMAVKFVNNNHYISTMNRDIAGGYISSFNSQEGKVMTDQQVLDKRIKFEEGVKDYVKQMGVDALNGPALAEKLSGLSKNGKMLAWTEGIEAKAGKESFLTEKVGDLYKDNLRGRNSALAGLKDNKALTGKKDYDDCLEEFDKLMKDIQKADKLFKEKGVYPRKELMEREARLSEKMGKYIHRKTVEEKVAQRKAHEIVKTKMHILTKEEREQVSKEVKEQNDKQYGELLKKYTQKFFSKTSNDRRKAMLFAQGTIQQRHGLDATRPEQNERTIKLAAVHGKKQPDFTTEEIAQPVKQQKQPENVKDPEVKKENGLGKVVGALESLIKQEGDLRNKYGNSKNLASDKEKFKKVGTSILDSAYRSLYLEVLKDDYSKKPHFPEEVEKQNLVTLKKCMTEGFTNPDNKKVFDAMKKSPFGLTFNTMVIDAAQKDQKLDHESLLKIRDEALTKTYTTEATKYTEEKKVNGYYKKHKANAADTIKMAKALGSNALDGKGKNLNVSGTEFKIKTELKVNVL